MSADAPKNLAARIPEEVTEDSLFEAFFLSVEEKGLTPYPAQEEAVLELMTGKHVVLNTPTGSGKSLVAVAMHFKGLAEGKRSFYTCPIKALVSEKFFALCEEFGAENVGMLTGDASINSDAPIICCTAEILSNIALRDGPKARVDLVVMDEFHYYSDEDRGVAWQVPLLRLPQATFLLMSATMGDNPRIHEGIEKITGTDVAIVKSTDRPVPLDFEYSMKPIHEALQDLVDKGKTPIYVVNFTQRECADMAQNLMSTNYCDKEHKKKISEALKGFRFDSPYGKDIQRYIRHGVGLHHAGLLPKYRLLMEQLSQQGLLKIICGTDTLGVGVNVPIRTVLFSKLCKFDGTQTRVLSARDFHQISGRAGRKGFDVEGSVVAQAPEHVIENARAEAKVGENPKKKKKFVKKKPPDRNYAHWDLAAFEKLRESSPEPLTSQFKITHGILLQILQGAEERDDDGWADTVSLIESSNCSDGQKVKLIEEAALYLDSLKRAGIVAVVDEGTDDERLTVDTSLQQDFSLHQASSLYVLDILPKVQEESEVYVLDVLTLVEAVLENPRIVLLRQLDKLKRDKVNELKAAGMPYDERMEELDKVELRQPNRDFLYMTFNDFAEEHPWVKAENIRPKCVAREMYEDYLSFTDYVREYGLERSEGVLLRYLSRFYKTLVQTIPADSKDESIYEAEVFFRTTLNQVDSSLLQEWEQLLNPTEDAGSESVERAAHPTDDMRSFRARIRTELHQLVRALSLKDYEGAVACVRPVEEDGWDESRFEKTMESFYDDYQSILFDHAARLPPLTKMESVSKDHWKARQVIVDDQEENFWVVETEILIDESFGSDVPVITLKSIHG